MHVSLYTTTTIDALAEDVYLTLSVSGAAFYGAGIVHTHHLVL